MITIPAAIGVILVAKPFINIIYGKDYLLATIPLFVLSVLVVEMGTGTLFSTVFSAREKPQIPARILVIATIMNILLNYLFIKLFLPLGQIYATLGVGLATVISRYFNFIMLAIAAKKEFNVSIDSISIVRPLFASLIMAIALIIFQQTTNLVWPVSIIEIIFGAIIYLVIMLLIKGIKKEDFELIKLLKSK
jgi:O-antigen/teichoic acid export membrane protein